MSVNRTSTFGDLLRRYRLAAGLSQEALAERAAISANAVAALERGRRAAPRPQTVSLLAGALELAPSDREELLRAAFERQAPTTAVDVVPPEAQQIRLPAPPTPLIERERDEAAISHLLTHGARLVTLTGPGGVGKTRVALQVASGLRANYADGAVFVDLSSLRDPELVPGALANALGLHETGPLSVRSLLVSHLSAKEMLLVLDNLEQVHDCAMFLSELLEACPSIAILATSRVPLQVRAEQLFSVQPLSVPDAPSGTPSEMSRYGAVQLFVARARSVEPAFTLTEENAAAVGEICRRLDGVPLAIELAAARVRLLPPGALLARLDRRLALLVAGPRDLPLRQQALRTTIGWSYDLLDEAERRLFRRVAVFSGGYTLEAAEAICREDPDGAGDLELLDGLGSLVDKSLIRRTESNGKGSNEASVGDSLRFSLLDTIHEYAREQLGAHEDVASVSRRHAEFFLRLATEAEVKLQGAEQLVWLARLERDHDNLRAALAWSQETGETELGLEIAGALWYFWFVHGHVTEGRHWLDSLLATADRASQVDPRHQARAMVGASWLAVIQGDHERAQELAQRSAALSREASDAAGVAASLTVQAVAWLNRGEYARARSLQEEALALQRQARDRWWTAAALNNLGLIAGLQRDFDSANALMRESLALRREIQDVRGTSAALDNLAIFAAAEGHRPRAQELWMESLTLYTELGDLDGALVVLEELAESFAAAQPVRAARLLGAADVARHRRGMPRPQFLREAVERATTTARERLDARAFAERFTEGQAMTEESAIRYALSDT